jgi:hypothetical protein
MSTLRVINLQNPSSGVINGTLNADGTTTFGGNVNFAASQTFPATSSGTAPTSPTTGATWYDTGVTPAVLKVWNGSAWVPVGNNQSATQPVSPTTGQQWTDTSTNPPVLKLWNGSSWVPATVAISNGVAPTSPVTGQLWSDTSTVPATLKAYNGTTWVPVQAAGGTPGFGLAIDGSATKVSITAQTGVPTVGTAANQAMTGSLYWDDTLGQLFIRYANGASPVWVAAAPAAGGGGSTYTGTAPIVVAGTAISITAATTGAAGVVTVGTNIDVTTGTISVKNASAADKGVIEIATLAEAATGTDATLALTPSTGVPKDAATMTGAAILPASTTANRPGTPVAGMFRVNTTTQSTEAYVNGAWNTVASTTNGQLAGFRNLLINGNFAINQRAYVSGTATSGAGQYTLDRWKVLVSGQNLAFAASGNGNQITAPAGGVQQVIEAGNVGGGTYTLSWTGTATADVNGTTVSNGAQVTLPANTQATVTFTSGTVTNAQLEPGSAATPFEQRLNTTELSLCRRYCYAIQTKPATAGNNGVDSVPFNLVGVDNSTPRKFLTFAETGAAYSTVRSNAPYTWTILAPLNSNANEVINTPVAGQYAYWYTGQGSGRSNSGNSWVFANSYASFGPYTENPANGGQLGATILQIGGNTTGGVTVAYLEAEL